MPGQGLENAPGTAFEHALQGLTMALQHVADQAASIIQMIFDFIMSLLGGG